MKLTKILSISIFLVGLALLGWGIAMWLGIIAASEEIELHLTLTSDSQSTTNAKILIAIGLTFCLNVLFVWKQVKMAQSAQAGFPHDDEFSRQLKYRAAHWAFHQSFFVWMVIFLFSHSFDKAETMLGLGMLAMAALYGINLLVLKGRGVVDEDPR